MHKSSVIVTLVSFLTIAFSSISEDTPDLVWFPNPTGDGTLIPASLVPSPGAKLGNISDIHFYLYTKNNTDKYDEISVGNLETVTNSHFIDGGFLKVLVHGFGSRYTDEFPYNMSAELLKLDGDQNVILVEWSILSASPDYFTAVANAQLASQHTTDLLEFLITEKKVQREKIHLIGYSLGGQVVGQVGSRVKEPLTRITALDPAFPLFDVADLHNRTDPTDAMFVDVIHTSAVLLGFFEPCGHVDWYPNGGRYQPGCGVETTGGCSHSRAPATFLESIFSEAKFWGRECATFEDFQEGTCNQNKTEVMGFHTPNGTRGVFFLETNSESPFAKGPL